MTRIAVCLAAYNGCAFLQEQVESILAQDGVQVQVFISVDRSTDGTEALFTRWALTEARLTLLPVGLVFGGAGPNFYRLIRDVDFNGYDYVSLADQDDIWFADKLLRAQNLLAEQDAAGYSGNVMAFWPNGRTSLIDKSQPQKQWDFLFESAGPGCTFVLRSDLALALQNLVRNRWEAVQAIELHDWLIYAFSRANGFKWVIDDQVHMQYRQHSKNQVGVNVGLRAFTYRVRKVLTGWGTVQTLRIASMVGLDDDPFVRQWKTTGRIGWLRLVLRARQCRRRPRDVLFFALSCLFLVVLGHERKL